MTQGFAGAQRSDSRRRRQITLNTPSLDADTKPATLDLRPQTGDPASLQSNGAIAPDLVSQVIPREVWKHALIIAGSGLLIAAVMWQLFQHPGQFLQAGVNAVSCARSISGILLLATGQLTLVIAFQRSRSEIDFRGQFRWWNWISFALIVVALLIVSNLLPLLPMILEAVVETVVGPVEAAKHAIVFVPATVLFFVLVSQLVPDMGRSRVSQGLFVAALLTFVVRQMLIETNAEETTAETSAILLLLSSFLAFSSTLLHARFVTYISRDPVQKSPAELKPEEPDDSTHVQVIPASATVTEKENAPLPAKNRKKRTRTKRRAA